MWFIITIITMIFIQLVLKLKKEYYIWLETSGNLRAYMIWFSYLIKVSQFKTNYYQLKIILCTALKIENLPTTAHNGYLNIYVFLPNMTA